MVRGTTHLFHEPALAIAVRVNLGVQLVHQARLLVLAGDRVTGVGVVGVSPGAILSERLGHTVLSGVSTVVAGKVVVLLAMVISGASSSSSLAATDTSLAVASAAGASRTAAVGVCASETSTGTRDALGSVRLTLVKTRDIAAMTGSVVVVTVAGRASNVVVVVVTGALTDSTKATSCAGTDVLGDTLEGIVALLTTGESSTLSLEFFHSHSGKSGGAVVGSLVVVNLVNRDCGVNNVGLDGLLLYDRLNGLVNVVVNVLTANGSSGALAVCGGIYTTLILEAGLLFDKISLGGVVVTMVELAVLDSAKLSSVLLGKDLTILDGLDCAVVVILVNLLVNGSLNLLMDVRLDNLVFNSRSNSLMDGGVVMSRLRHKVSDSCLGLIHCELSCC